MKKLYINAVCGVLSALFVLSVQAGQLDGEATQFESSDKQMLADIQPKTNSSTHAQIVVPNKESVLKTDYAEGVVDCFMAESANDPLCKEN